MNRKILFYSCLFMIVYFSIVPQNSDDPSMWSAMMFTESGFFQHVFGYFVLSALACYAFSKNNIWKILAGILIMGVGLEMIQYVLPSRTFNVYDSLANLIGVLGGVLSFKVLGFKGLRRFKVRDAS